MKLCFGIMCLILILCTVHAAPRHRRHRRAESEKTNDKKVGNKQEISGSGSGDGEQQKGNKRQYIPYEQSYTMADAVSESSQPVQVVQIRDLSITNGVIKKSNIVQL